MTVKIIADSLGDVPADVVKELGITVIPIQVLFGTECFRDGVDLTSEQFYEKLVRSKVLPTTAVPSLGTFAEIYDQVAKNADDILVLTISHKLSATYDTAVHAVEIMKKKARVKVINTTKVLMAEGLIVIEAAKAAKSGASMDELIRIVEQAMPRIDIRMAFDTLEYLKRGGRIGAAQAFLGSMLKVNPVLTLKDGEAHPVARERSRTKAMDHLYNFAISYSKVDAFAIEDATTPVEADALAERIKAKFPGKPMYRSKVSPVLGAHVGPSVVCITVLGDKK